MKRIVLAVVFLLLAGALPAQTFDDAVAAYKRGEVFVAAQAFIKLAEQGDAKAQFILGTMYSAGKGVPQDDNEAVRWYHKAAGLGLAEAQFSLGLLYETGEGVAQDRAEAVRWYRMAAEGGNAKAQASLRRLTGDQTS